MHEREPNNPAAHAEERNLQIFAIYAVNAILVAAIATKQSNRAHSVRQLSACFKPSVTARPLPHKVWARGSWTCSRNTIWLVNLVWACHGAMPEHDLVAPASAASQLLGARVV